jgi:hypothetical protein
MTRALPVLVAFVAACTGCAPPSGSSTAQSDRSSVGYASVQEALAALRAKPGAHVGEQDGWTVIEDPESEKSMALWSFAPASDPAYPSAVKRLVFEKDGTVQIDMRVLCESPKPACDQLVQDFEALNDRAKQGFGDQR